MRRPLFAAIVITFGLLAPISAAADEPEAAPAPETVPVAPGITCTANKGHPFHEIAGQFPYSSYLSSYGSVTCSESGNYRIDRYRAELRHGVYINGAWGPYSDEASIRDRSGPGTVSFSPSRDLCDTGGASRLYRQRMEVEVTSRYAIGGQARHDTVLFIVANVGTIGCGNTEPN